MLCIGWRSKVVSLTIDRDQRELEFSKMLRVERICSKQRKINSRANRLRGEKQERKDISEQRFW